MSTRTRVAALGGSLLIAATSVGGALASSHREAPLIAGDPAADNTDLWAFVSPDDPTKVAIIANYVPLEEPAGGPNFNGFDPAARYEIHIDNDGDALDDVTFRFTFRTIVQRENFAGIPTYLYNDGPVTSARDANLLVRQSYDVTRIVDGRAVVVGRNLPVPPTNIGPRSTPNYAQNFGAKNVRSLDLSHGKVFAGPRDDGFFVDLGSIFDLGGLRPFNGAHLVPLDAEAGDDAVAGFNTHSIALEIPIAKLTADRKLPTGPNDPDAVLGIWASASRRATKTITSDGRVVWSGAWRQVSRLGNPLVNEVIIPRHLKDYWNSQPPSKDKQFLRYYRSPELAALVNVLYPSLPDARTSGRDDLAAILLTGLDLRGTPAGINLNGTGPVLADMLRLNTAIAPTADVGEGDRMGVLAGDVAGFPNGRRLEDDVVDIEIRAVADGYGEFVNSILGDLTPNNAPNNVVGDGVDENDVPFVDAFPYQAAPHGGYEHEHHVDGPEPL